MKDGAKTTEWWLTLLVVVGSALMASGILIDQPEALRIVEVVVGLLAQLGYTASRTLIKRES